MALDIKFRSNNPPLWSAYTGNRLPASIADQNMYNIKVAIEALQDNPPSPDEISAITTFGVSWIVSFDSGRQLTVPVEVLAWGWRGFWTPFTTYQAFDGFAVEGVGLFYVNIAHLSPAVFDANYEVTGNPAYHAIYIDGTAANSSIIYDMGAYYGPKLADNIDDTLWEFPAVRKYAIPVSGHIARLKVPPSTADQVILLVANGITEIGTITFAVGNDQGVFSIAIEVEIDINEMFAVRKPSSDDATASGLSITFAFRRVV